MKKSISFNKIAWHINIFNTTGFTLNLGSCFIYLRDRDFLFYNINRNEIYDSRISKYLYYRELKKFEEINNRTSN